ncbi:unnamed protein product [Amaranthus hypochondriacus]
MGRYNPDLKRGEDKRRNNTTYGARMDSRKGENKEEASAAMAGSDETMGFSNPNIQEEGKASLIMGKVTRLMSPLTNTLLVLKNKFGVPSFESINDYETTPTNFNHYSDFNMDTSLKEKT